MNDKNMKISTFGLFASIVVTSIGVNVFSYPRELATYVGTDGWIAIIINTVIAFGVIYIINKIMIKNEYRHCYEIFTGFLGTIIGNIVSLSFIIYSIFVASTGLRMFGEEIKAYLLQKTPIEFIFIITILASVYLVRGGIDNIIRFNQICFWIMFIPIAIVFIFAIYGVDFSNLLPVFTHKPSEYFKATISGIYRYGGFEILFLIIPSVLHKKSINKVALNSVVFIGLFYIITFILTIAAFGSEGTKRLMWPTITMIKNINIPGSFIERWEGIVMSIWIIFYMTTLVNLYYFSADILKRMIKVDDVKLSSSIIVPFIYLIALYPSNVADLNQITGKYTMIMFMINLVIIPIVLFISSCFKRKGGKLKNE